MYFSYFSTFDSLEYGSKIKSINSPVSLLTYFPKNGPVLGRKWHQLFSPKVIFTLSMRNIRIFSSKKTYCMVYKRMNKGAASFVYLFTLYWVYKSSINNKVNTRQDAALDPYLPYPLRLTHEKWRNLKGIPYQQEKPHFVLTRLKMVGWGALFFNVFLLPFDPSWANGNFMGPISPDPMGMGQLSRILPAAK